MKIVLLCFVLSIFVFFCLCLFVLFFCGFFFIDICLQLSASLDGSLECTEGDKRLSQHDVSCNESSDAVFCKNPGTLFEEEEKDNEPTILSKEDAELESRKAVKVVDDDDDDDRGGGKGLNNINKLEGARRRSDEMCKEREIACQERKIEESFDERNGCAVEGKIEEKCSDNDKLEAFVAKSFKSSTSKSSTSKSSTSKFKSSSLKQSTSESTTTKSSSGDENNDGLLNCAQETKKSTTKRKKLLSKNQMLSGSLISENEGGNSPSGE